MYTEYQGQMTATLNWGSASAAAGSGESGREYLDRVLDHFWSTVQRIPY